VVVKKNILKKKNTGRGGTLSKKKTPIKLKMGGIVMGLRTYFKNLCPFVIFKKGS